MVHQNGPKWFLFIWKIWSNEVNITSLNGWLEICGMLLCEFGTICENKWKLLQKYGHSHTFANAQNLIWMGYSAAAAAAVVADKW